MYAFKYHRPTTVRQVGVNSWGLKESRNGIPFFQTFLRHKQGILFFVDYCLTHHIFAKVGFQEFPVSVTF